jgi:hypothetical protein
LNQRPIKFFSNITLQNLYNEEGDYVWKSQYDQVKRVNGFIEEEEWPCLLYLYKRLMERIYKGWNIVEYALEKLKLDAHHVIDTFVKNIG